MNNLDRHKIDVDESGCYVCSRCGAYFASKLARLLVMRSSKSEQYEALKEKRRLIRSKMR